MPLSTHAVSQNFANEPRKAMPSHPAMLTSNQGKNLHVVHAQYGKAILLHEADFWLPSVRRADSASLVFGCTETQKQREMTRSC